MRKVAEAKVRKKAKKIKLVKKKKEKIGVFPATPK